MTPVWRCRHCRAMERNGDRCGGCGRAAPVVTFVYRCPDCPDLEQAGERCVGCDRANERQTVLLPDDGEVPR
jgi:hypothetical protein